jgi:hypothetical protein
MSKTAIYNFAQLEPIKGIDLMVTGECEITYSLCRREPDVGIMQDWFEFDVGRIWLHSTKPDGQMLELPADNWLHKLIESYLGYEDREYVEEFLADDYEPADY